MGLDPGQVGGPVCGGAAAIQSPPRRCIPTPELIERSPLHNLSGLPYFFVHDHITRRDLRRRGEKRCDILPDPVSSPPV